MGQTRMIGLLTLLAACGDDGLPPEGPLPPSTYEPNPPYALPADAAGVRDASTDAPVREAPGCTVAAASSTDAAVTVSWTVACPAGGQVLLLPQVGVGTTYGDNDSLVVDCGSSGSLELDLAPAAGGPPWAMIDTLEFPYTMDSAFGHCGTAGSP